VILPFDSRSRNLLHLGGSVALDQNLLRLHDVVAKDDAIADETRIT
jgi:hypothetical protein